MSRSELVDERAIVREAIADVLWGYVGLQEAQRIAEEVLDVVPGLIRQRPSVFGLTVESLPGGAYSRIAGEWRKVP